MGADPLLGQVLHDTHKIVRVIGQGGMGKVYEAEHVRLPGQRFAVKVLSVPVNRDKEIYIRFQREALIASRLGHPGIVSVKDFYEHEDGRPCIVMEYLDGEDLARRLAREGRLNASMLGEVMKQVGAALTCAHLEGIIHRDLKPANIFLLQEAGGALQVKLLDFGVARIRDSLITRQGAVFGTPYYMPPEQAKGLLEKVDARSDIFSLGVLAYQALSGELPFQGDHFVVVLRRVCAHDPTPLEELCPAVTRRTGEVVSRAMAKQPEDRYASVTTFVEELLKSLCQGHSTDKWLAPILLRCEMGCDPQRIYPVEPGRSILGRSHLATGFSADVDLKSQEVLCARPTVSRRHAEISVSRRMEYVVQDLGSSNGTRLNGQLLASGEPHLLGVGDTLEVGEVRLVVERRQE